jgi:hypothetical protein
VKRARPRRAPRVWVVLAAALGAVAAHAIGDWSVFSPPEGHFRVELPGLPELVTKARLTPLGEVHETRYWLRTGDAELAVEMHDMPSVATAVLSDELILDRALEGVIENEGGTRIDARALTVQGAPAREFSYRLPARPGEPERIERALSVLVGARLYLLTGITADPATNPDVARFFASFQFWRNGEGP